MEKCIILVVLISILLLRASSTVAKEGDRLPVANHPGIEFRPYHYSFYSHLEYVDFGFPDQNFERHYHPENLIVNVDHPSDLAHFHTPMDFQNPIVLEYNEAKRNAKQLSDRPVNYNDADQLIERVQSLTTSMETVLAMKKLESAYKIYEAQIIKTCLSGSLPDGIVPRDVFDQKYKKMIEGMPNDYQIVINDTSTQLFYDKIICQCIHLEEDNRLIVSVPIPVVKKTQNFKLIGVTTVPYGCGEDQVCEISFEQDLILYLEKDSKVVFVVDGDLECLTNTKYCEIPSILEAEHEDNLCIRDIIRGDVKSPYCKVLFQGKYDKTEHEETWSEGILIWFQTWAENFDSFSSFIWLAYIILVISCFNRLIR